MDSQNKHNPHSYLFQLNLHQQQCWKCKKTGELSCCDNCFRSYHKICINNIIEQTSFSRQTEIQNPNTIIILDDDDIPQNNSITNNNLKNAQQFAKLAQQKAPYFNPIRSPKPWLCECCIMRFLQICLVCRQNIHEPKNNLICSICYRLVHLGCSNLPEQILGKPITLFGYQTKEIRNFICQQCFQKNKIGSIIRVERLNSQRFAKSQQISQNTIKQHYLFTTTQLTSPVHTGWIRTNFKTENSRTVKLQQLRQKKIVQILHMKAPLRYTSASIEDIVYKIFQIFVPKHKNLTFHPPARRSYGHCDNFTFLCLWDGNDYNSTSWEDQTVVVKFQVPLKKFLYFKVMQQQKMTLILQNLLGVFRTPNAVLHQDDLQIFRKLQERYYQYKYQIFSVQKTQKMTKYSILCHLISYFQKIHLSKLQKDSFPTSTNILDRQTMQINWSKFLKNALTVKPAVIICAEQNYPEWSKALRQLCPILNVLAYRGSQENLKIIRMEKYFPINDKNWLFQVYLTTFQTYHQVQHRNYFLQLPKVIHTQLLIIDQQTPLQFFNLDFPFKSNCFYILRNDQNYQLQSETKNKIFQRHGLKNLIYYSMHQELPLNQQYQINFKQAKALNDKMVSIINQDIIKYKSYSSVPEIKRSAFLRFIMYFGINEESFDKLYNNIVTFEPTIFQDTEQQKKQLESYHMKFLALIYHYNNPSIDQRYIQFYLFDIERSQVFKRICQLVKLKEKLKPFQKEPQRFNVEKSLQLTHGNNIIKFNRWNGVEDYILSNLLLEKGYGRWNSILETKNWAKCIKDSRYYADNVQYQQDQDKYKVHLKKITDEQILQGSISYQNILQQRAALYLKLLK